MKRQRDTCFHCPCGVFRHRDSKETRRHAKNCKLASMPETRVMRTTRRTLRSSRQRRPPQRQPSPSSSSSSSSSPSSSSRSDGGDHSNNNEQQGGDQDNHPNARMEALASAAGAVRSSSSEESSTTTHGMLTRGRARATTPTTTTDLFQQVTSLVAADTRSPIHLLQSNQHHHREPRLFSSQRGALRFSFDVLHGHHVNRRIVSIHIALHSSMIDVLTMARIITRVCDSVPGGGAPTSIRIWRPSSFSS